MIHLSVMIAWHDSGWNRKACENPEDNIYCESFGYIRRNKWKDGKLRCPKGMRFQNYEKAPCLFEQGIFSFDQTRPFHLKSVAFGGWGISEKEVEKFIYPRIAEKSSLIFLFCRENPISEERIIVGCIKFS